jgi:CRISPR-associated endonuclease Csn1
MGFDGKRMGYSIKALKNLAALMQDSYDERAAIEQAYPERFKKKPLSRELPLPEETGNTVVDVALRQVYRAVRGAMDAMGGLPSQVIVELSRDMALGLKQRREIEIRINLNNKARREAAKAIAEHGQQVTDKKIGRYLLWQQQLHYCPYCDRRIELGEALGSTTEREHILPRTLTRVGGKRSQLVLAHKTCNNEKGNRTPWQAFGPDEVRWRIIEERAAQLKKNKQWGKAKLLLLKDWEGEVLDDKAIRDFTDRQFHESSWIAKLTAQWLRNVCNDVAVSRGQMTAHLRRIWKLDTVIPQVRYAANLPVLDRESKPKPITEEEFQRYKLWWEGHDERAGGVPTNRKPEKRIDHRHHLIDALVISLTGRKLFKKMANHYKVESEKAQRGEYARLRLFEKPPVPALRDLALSIITNAQIRHKQDHHASGPMFEATAYGISRKPDENGNRRLAVSKPLTALLDKDNAAKTRKRLEEIESETTRIIVLKEFDRRIAAGTPLKQIFAPPMLHPQFRTPIRRVRLRLKESVETAAGVIHTNRHGKELRKQYMHDGYAYLEIRVEDGKMTGKPRPVPMQQAMKERALQPIDGLRQFWKNDTVVDHKTGLPYLIRQIKAQGGGMLVLTPATEAREVRDMSSKDGLQSISGAGLVRLAPR